MSQEKNTATEMVEANWDALMMDPDMGDPNYKREEPKQEDATLKDVVEEDKEKVDPPAEPEKEVKEEKQDTAKEETKEEAKTEEETEDEIQFSVDEIPGVPKTYKENSFQDIAQKMGVEIPEDNFDVFKEQFVPKTEVEKMVVKSKEDLFSTLKPEVATALELLEAGVPENLILEPTKELDTYLAMESVDLVRAEYATRPGWTEDMINTEIDSLVESGKIDHEASKIRVQLEADKKVILEQTKEIFQRHTEGRKQAELARVEQERNQTIEALNKVPAFMDVKIPQNVKDALVAKYRKGEYDKELSSPQARAEFIIKKELEAQIAKHLRNKVSEKVKKEATDKLLNIPPVKAAGGGAVKQPASEDNWGAIEKDFGS